MGLLNENCSYKISNLHKFIQSGLEGFDIDYV